MARLQPINIVRAGDFRGISGSILEGGRAKARRKEKIAQSIALGFSGFADAKFRKDQQESLEEHRGDVLDIRKDELKERQFQFDETARIRLEEASLEAQIRKMTGGEAGTVDALRKWLGKSAEKSGEASAELFLSGADARDPDAMRKGATGAAEAAETKEALKPTIGSDPKRVGVPSIDVSGHSKVEVDRGLDAVAIAQRGLDLEEARLKKQLGHAAKSLKAASGKASAGRDPDVAERAKVRVKKIRGELSAHAGRQAELDNNERRLKQRQEVLKTEAAEVRMGKRRRDRSIEATEKELNREARRLVAAANERGRVLDEVEARAQAGVSISIQDVSHLFDEKIVGEFGEELGEHEFGRVKVAGEDVHTRVPSEIVSFARAKYGNAQTKAEFKDARDDVEKMAKRFAKNRTELIVGRKEAMKREHEEATADFGKAFGEFEKRNRPTGEFGFVGPEHIQASREAVHGNKPEQQLVRYLAFQRAEREFPVDPDFLASLTDKEKLALRDELFGIFNLPAGYKPPVK